MFRIIAQRAAATATLVRATPMLQQRSFTMLASVSPPQTTLSVPARHFGAKKKGGSTNKEKNQEQKD
jgi:hypothetical protein